MPRLRVGLTGGIASGKSTVAARFIELGVPVIDADEAARAVVVPGSPGLAQVTAAFGPGVLTVAGGLDRRILRQLIFSDPLQRKSLESILHPLIQAEMEHRTGRAGGAYVVIATPLLVEGGHLDRFDRILVVDADEAVQLNRLMARDASSRAEASAILAAQTSRRHRLDAADDVITNEGTVADLRQAVDDLHERYLMLAKSPSG